MGVEQRGHRDDPLSTQPGGEKELSRTKRRAQGAYVEGRAPCRILALARSPRAPWALAPAGLLKPGKRYR